MPATTGATANSIECAPAASWTHAEVRRQRVGRLRAGAVRPGVKPEVGPWLRIGHANGRRPRIGTRVICGPRCKSNRKRKLDAIAAAVRTVVVRDGPATNIGIAIGKTTCSDTFAAALDAVDVVGTVPFAIRRRLAFVHVRLRDLGRQSRQVRHPQLHLNHAIGGGLVTTEPARATSRHRT